MGPFWQETKTAKKIKKSKRKRLGEPRAAERARRAKSSIKGV
jgi:hypothetical protein